AGAIAAWGVEMWERGARVWEDRSGEWRDQNEPARKTASTATVAARADLAMARPVSAGVPAGSRKRAAPGSPAGGRKARPRQRTNTAAVSVTYLACRPTRVANPGPPAFSRPMATGRMSA